MVFRGSPKYLENYNEPIVTESSKFIEICVKNIQMKRFILCNRVSYKYCFGLLKKPRNY
ncbi:MAG: hypothetical protein Ct9H90mP3_6570 [Flammeovirgaceae bacterium]|nr:MAG: hypothetical protein Ct9H90mP3_6570 [Flammeovirgaceae bacterium]